MRPLIREISTSHTPESLVAQLCQNRSRGEEKALGSGVLLLRSSRSSDPAEASSELCSSQARYSFVTANPFLTFRSSGSRCEIVPGETGGGSMDTQVQFGNPWRLLEELMPRYELLDEIDLPFPLGGCFGFWGYELKNFVEPRLSRRTVVDLDLPDSYVGFHDSVVVFDHFLQKTWIVSTGLRMDGTRCPRWAESALRLWETLLRDEKAAESVLSSSTGEIVGAAGGPVVSNMSRTEFITAVRRAQAYIRSGDIYQVNLSHRLTAALNVSGWDLFRRLSATSPAPFAAFMDCGDFQIASSSPERFLRLSGGQIQTRPIKGTRPRSSDATRDAQLSYELQTSGKEMAELVMITDLLRNDLGKVCEFGSVHVPELVRLERFAQVQHLVSTVEGRLRSNETHFSAFASCFPGGSVTGAPKIRAMEIIDELEPVARGPYTGAIGYLGFNRESQLNIAIRTAVCKEGNAHFNVGAGIVADSDPEAEYAETLAKASGFFTALGSALAISELANQ
jgi:para-aminobenzoate synthetase component 1